jgi:hypothetical protein
LGCMLLSSYFFCFAFGMHRCLLSANRIWWKAVEAKWPYCSVALAMMVPCPVLSPFHHRRQNLYQRHQDFRVIPRDCPHQTRSQMCQSQIPTLKTPCAAHLKLDVGAKLWKDIRNHLL